MVIFGDADAGRLTDRAFALMCPMGKVNVQHRGSFTTKLDARNSACQALNSGSNSFAFEATIFRNEADELCGLSRAELGRTKLC